MIKDAIIKEIDRLRDEKNHLWGTMVISFGSSITLILGSDLSKIIKLNPIDLSKLILALGGIYFSYILLNSYFARDNIIKKLINKLEEGKIGD